MQHLLKLMAGYTHNNDTQSPSNLKGSGHAFLRFQFIGFWRQTLVGEL
jgi:hypothetical protein